MLNTLIDFVTEHPTSSVVIANYIFNAAIGSLPMPNGSGKFYKWFFAFSNTLAANLQRAKVGINGGVVIPIRKGE